MKKVLFSLVLLGFSQATMAYSASNEQEIKLEVYRKAANFIDSVHCLWTDETSPREQFRRIFKNTHTDELDAYYYVFLAGLQGCWKGNSTDTNFLVPVVASSTTWNVVVRPVDLFEGLDFNKRFIESVKQEGNNLIIISREHDDVDPYNSPTLKYQYKIALPDTPTLFDEGGSLRILERKFLKRIH